MTDAWTPADRALRRHGVDVTALPRVGDPTVRGVSYIEAYNQLVAVSMARAEFLGELIQRQLDNAGLVRIRRTNDGDDTGDPNRETYDVFVERRFAMVPTGPPDGDGPVEMEPVEIGESIRALITLEAQERDRAAKLIRDALKIGAEVHAVEAARTYGQVGAYSIQAFVRELGLDEHSAEVLHAAQRAVYAGRRAAGQDDGDPDVEVGPKLTEAAQARARQAARTLG